MDFLSSCGSSDDSSDEASEMFMQIAIHRHQRRLNKRANQVATRRARLNRNREAGHQMLLNDYFNDDCVYPESAFHQRFRMSRRLFLRIVDDLTREVPWFTQRSDARGRIGFTPLQKCVGAFRMMAYGVTGDCFDEYLRMSDRTMRSCVQKFCKGLNLLYHRKYLRRPTPSDIKQLYEFHEQKWGFRGMLGSIDCSHWAWKNCPNAWRGQFTRGDHGHPSISLEAVASHDLWIWHQFFGVAGSNNDINVLDQSTVWDHIIEGQEHDSSFELRGVTYKRGYYLGDGIYPEYSTLVKGFTKPIGERRKVYTRAHRAARSDIERCFGRLKSKWHIIQYPARVWHQDKIANVMRGCLLMHNMILEDEEKLICEFHEDELDITYPEITEEEKRAKRQEIRNRDIHNQLKSDLIEDLYERMS